MELLILPAIPAANIARVGDSCGTVQHGESCLASCARVSSFVHVELNPVDSRIFLLPWMLAAPGLTISHVCPNELIVYSSLFNFSLDTGLDQQNIPDNIPVRGLEGSFADAEMHPGAFARQEHSFNAEDPARSAIHDAPGDAAEEDCAIDPPTGATDAQTCTRVPY